MNHKEQSQKKRTTIIAVIAIAILVLLAIFAAYFTVTGQAIGSSQFSIENFLGLVEESDIQKGAKEGRGTLTCNDICSQQGKLCIIAYEGKIMRKCSDAIKEYQCVCTPKP